MGTIHSNSRGCSQGQIFSRRSSRENQSNKGDKANNQHNPLTEKISSESRSDVPSQFSPALGGDHSPGLLSSDSECPSPRSPREEHKEREAEIRPPEKPLDSPSTVAKQTPENSQAENGTQPPRDDGAAGLIEKVDVEKVATEVDGEEKESKKTSEEQEEKTDNNSAKSKSKDSQRPVVKIELVQTPSEERHLESETYEPLQEGEITPENDVEHNLSPITPNLSSESVSGGPKQSRSFPNLTVSTGSKSPGASPSPSPTPSAHSNRFSFFRGIQNVIHVNRWIKKTHQNQNRHPEGEENGAASKEDKNVRVPISPDTLKEFEDLYNEPPPELTERQKELLRTSWHEIGNDISQVGVIAFTGLFDSHPDVQDTFLPFRGLSSTDLSNSAMLREHALRVMTTVEKFVHRVDAPDKLQAILEDVGRRHFDYRIKVEYINIVGTQFMRAVQPHVAKWTEEMEDAWMAMVNMMTYHMTRGILDTNEELVTAT